MVSNISMRWLHKTVQDILKKNLQREPIKEMHDGITAIIMIRSSIELRLLEEAICAEMYVFHISSTPGESISQG